MSRPTPASEPPVSDRLAPGTLLQQRYEIVRPIGSGGMGDVYEAIHLLLRKRVAIKVLHDQWARDRQVVARFVGEARAATLIGHPHIVAVTDFGTTDDGRPFSVMEHLDGLGLDQHLRASGPMAWPHARALALQVASALSAAHGEGIVHRDLKPSNVVLTRRPEGLVAKVVDFGIAKVAASAHRALSEDLAGLTRPGTICGTPEYMAPEQAYGDAIDARADVYALGVVLFEMVTGRLPFTGPTPMAIVARHLSEPPPAPRLLRPDLSELAEAVILQALAKEPSRRFQSMTALAAALTACPVDAGDHAPLQPVAARPLSAPSHTPLHATPAPSVRGAACLDRDARPSRQRGDFSPWDGAIATRAVRAAAALGHALDLGPVHSIELRGAGDRWLGCVPRRGEVLAVVAAPGADLVAALAAEEA